MRCSFAIVTAILGASALALTACSRDGASDGTPTPLDTTHLFGSLGDTPGLFAYPRCLESDGTSLWVIDKTARIQRIDPESGECTALWQMPDWQLGKPVGFGLGPTIPAANPEADDAPPFLLYIADTHYNRVMIYAPPAPANAQLAPTPGTTREYGTPPLVASFGSYGTGPGQFIYPTDVCVITAPGSSRVERLFVSEYGGNDRISAYSPDLTFLFSFGSYGDSASPDSIQFDRPQTIISVTLDEQRLIVVTDSRNHRVGVFTLNGALVRWIGSRDTSGRALGSFRYPYGLASLDDGTVLVAEYGNNRVQRINLHTGAGIATFGTAGRDRGQLAVPWAIANCGKTTFILDSGNNRIQGIYRPRAQF